MKFKDWFLKEAIDYDDPTERYWDRKPIEKPKIEKEKIYSKPIMPLTKEDLVYIKCISVLKNDPYLSCEMYLTNDDKRKYTYDKNKASRFPLSVAEKFIEKHPKFVRDDGIGNKYDTHFELEQVKF